MACPLCKGHKIFNLYASQDRMFGINGTFHVKQCLRCDQVFLVPILSVRQVRKYYPSKSYYAYSETVKQGVLQKLRSYLLAHYYKPTVLSAVISFFIHNIPAIPEQRNGGKFLDVGCGTGDTLMLLSKLGWKVYGMEMDKHAAIVCKKRGLKNIHLGTFEGLATYSDNTFDAIRLYHVIEHLQDPQLCFKLLYKKLKKGGELIIGTPNISSIVARIFGTYWYNLDSPRHVFLFSPQTLKRLAQSEGFVVKSTEYCSAGGVAGSLQYWLDDNWNLHTNLIHRLWCIVLFYPLEWILDIFHTGDVFVMRMTK